jgi:hypothetical protein
MDDLDLIARLREFERLNNTSNPFTPQVIPDRLPTLAVTNNPVPQERVGLSGIGSAIGESAGNDDYSNELMQKYMAQLDQMPVRQKPGLLKSILAGAASISNPEAADNIAFGGYNRAMDDWKLATEAIGKGAQQERLYNVNTRQTKALEETERHRRVTEQQGSDRLEMQKAKFALDKYRAEHPNAKFEIDEQGRFISISPEGKATYVISDDGTPVQSRHISDEDKLNMQLEGSLTKMKNQGEITRENQAAIEAIRSRNDLTEIEKRGEIAKVLKQIVPGGAAAAANKPESEAARRTRWVNNANQLKVEKPWFSQYITMDGNNVSITAPKPGVFGNQARGTPTQAEYDEIKKFIFDRESTPVESPIEQQPVIPEETVKSAASPVKSTGVKAKRMVDPQGKEYDISTWSEEDIKQAKARGFKEK